MINAGLIDITVTMSSGRKMQVRADVTRCGDYYEVVACWPETASDRKRERLREIPPHLYTYDLQEVADSYEKERLVGREEALLAAREYSYDYYRLTGSWI